VSFKVFTHPGSRTATKLEGDPKMVFNFIVDRSTTTAKIRQALIESWSDEFGEGKEAELGDAPKLYGRVLPKSARPVHSAAVVLLPDLPIESLRANSYSCDQEDSILFDVVVIWPLKPQKKRKRGQQGADDQPKIASFVVKVLVPVLLNKRKAIVADDRQKKAANFAEIPILHGERIMAIKYKLLQAYNEQGVNCVRSPIESRLYVCPRLNNKSNMPAIESTSALWQNTTADGSNTSLFFKKMSPDVYQINLALAAAQLPLPEIDAILSQRVINSPQQNELCELFSLPKQSHSKASSTSRSTDVSTKIAALYNDPTSFFHHGIHQKHYACMLAFYSTRANWSVFLEDFDVTLQPPRYPDTDAFLTRCGGVPEKGKYPPQGDANEPPPYLERKKESGMEACLTGLAASLEALASKSARGNPDHAEHVDLLKAVDMLCTKFDEAGDDDMTEATAKLFNKVSQDNVARLKVETWLVATVGQNYEKIVGEVETKAFLRKWRLYGMAGIELPPQQ
jgi:hypothetical protein